MPQKPAQPQDKYVLRMPDGMRERIKHAADDNGRSMNSEIVQRIENSFRPEYPKYPEHDLLDEEQLIEAINRYSVCIQDCVSALQHRKRWRESG